MTTTAARRLVLGAVTTVTSTEAGSTADPDPRAAVLRPPVAEATSHALSGVLARLPGPQRAAAQVVLAAHDYCVTAARDFVARYHDEKVRLRAIHSVALETSRLLHPATETVGDDARWLGRAFVITSPDRGALQALRWAGGHVASGQADAVVVCEVTATTDAHTFRATALPVMCIGVAPRMCGPAFDAAEWRHALERYETLDTFSRPVAGALRDHA